jgi:DNA-binding SARP family transcriptional activator/tetratricopeptide (TPR) repeat protein
MDFRLFGPFEVWQDHVPLDPGDLQQRYVLVNLLLNANRAVTREYLQEYIWRGQGQPRSDLITSYIARLRKAFKDTPDVVIDKSPTGYLIRLDPDLIDLNRFRRLCRQARDTNDAAVYREALDLWRGPFLSDMDVDRVGGPTVVPSEEDRVDALVDLAELELAAGEHRRIRDRLRPVWEEDRSQQRLAAALMRALIEAGDHVRAVEVYHQTREALDEYGMDVSRELREMMRRAQYGDRLSSLPMRQTRFAGRVDELTFVEEVARSALEGGQSVLWISGMPGVGKTALAVNAAHRLGDVFPDGRLFVDLTGFTPNVAPTPPAAALARLLTDLGVRPEAIPESTVARADLYRSTVGGTRTLVVLDNAASEDQVKPLLGAALTVVTSREQGALLGARYCRLEPLPPHEAVELFRELVTAERVHGHMDQVREIVALCGHVPLLVHLVAVQFQRHPRWPLTHMLDLLREVPPVSPATTFPQAATVACTVSYNQLTEEQQTLFRVFALAPGADLSASAAAALMGVPRATRLLEDLHRVSLLEESAPERFQMLDPLRDYVLAAHPPEDLITPVDRLLDFYLVTTAAAMATLFPFDRDRQPAPTVTSPAALSFTDRDAAMGWLDDERYNLVAAVGHAADHDRPEHAWRLAVLLWRYLYVRGHRREWTDTLQHAARALRHSNNIRGHANVLLRLSEARRNSGALTEARALAEQALPLWVELGDVRGEATTLVAIATNAYMTGDFPAAAEHLTTALDRYEKTGDASGHAHALDLFGLASERRGDLLDAERKHLAAVELLRGIDHRPGLAHCLDNLGYVRQRLGKLDEALANHTEARELAVELGDPGTEAYALNNLGNTHRLAGRLEEAVSYQLHAQKVADLVEDPNLRTQLYFDRGETARAVGDNQAALHNYRAALDLSAGMGERVQRARANHRIAAILHDTGRHTSAPWHDALSEYTDLDLPEADEVRAELDQLTCSCSSFTTDTGVDLFPLH